MFTNIDSGKGVVKTAWKNVRERVFKANPKFAALIDDVAPDGLNLYLVYLPYGYLQADTESVFLPDQNNIMHKLDSVYLPKQLHKDLSYGIKSLPLGMILEKSLEYFIDLPNLELTLPRFVKHPGYIFPLSMIYQKTSNRNYAPNGILKIMSGCRSVFMLPNINSKRHYQKLQYDYGLKSHRPESLYHHFDIFKELSSGPHVQKPWATCLMYFSQDWIDKIMNDPAWYKIKMYLCNRALRHFEPEMQKHLLDFLFSHIQIIRNLKPNPYIADTARHIINTAIGSVPGYAPTNNEEYLPLSVIEQPFIESYGMKKYYPTVLHPENYMFEESDNPIYYSLQYPAVHNFSPKSRTVSSMIVEMRELATILEIFLEHLSEQHPYCSGTVYSDLSKYLNIRCIHNEPDRHKIINTSNMLLNIDRRFQSNFKYETIENQKFASDGKFFRGCVVIHKKPPANTLENLHPTGSLISEVPQYIKDHQTEYLSHS